MLEVHENFSSLELLIKIEKHGETREQERDVSLRYGKNVCECTLMQV